MFVIGTAGHVDHGKSTLIKAMTGIDPDRLAEEKAREMTIDLGFAWLLLGDDEKNHVEVGVVDVPGHRDFIENMLAGIAGIDLAILVIAADEGVMPQTREHLAILDLLEVKSGVVALTKSDLVADDPEWIELVTLEISEVLEGTVLAEAPIIPVSAKTNAGISPLKSTLWKLLQQTDKKSDAGRARLPIDRVFTLSGFGTVVTGTLLGGSFRSGDQVTILPGSKQGRIRGLQTHRTKREVAYPGSRVAINLTGIDHREVQRGQIVTIPGSVGETVLFDAAYRHLADAGIPLKHNMEIKLFVGSAEVLARTRVLGSKEINAGEEGWLQIACRQPVAVVRGDKFIIRRPSPGQTLGGGRILDPQPGRQHRRFKPQVVSRLQTLTQGTAEELLVQALARDEPAKRNAIFSRSGLDEAKAQAAWAKLVEGGGIIVAGKQAVSRQRWQQWQSGWLDIVKNFHEQSPLRPGIAREELRSRLRMPASFFNEMAIRLTANKLLVEIGPAVALASHQIEFSAAQKAAIDKLMQRFENAGIKTPTIKECQAMVGEDVYFALVGLDKLRPLNQDVVYTPAQYELIIQQILEYLKKNERITAAQTRDLLQTSRKYAIAWLEHLDVRRLTKRVGDERVLN